MFHKSATLNLALPTLKLSPQISWMSLALTHHYPETPASFFQVKLIRFFEDSYKPVREDSKLGQGRQGRWRWCLYINILNFLIWKGHPLTCSFPEEQRTWVHQLGFTWWFTQTCQLRGNPHQPVMDGFLRYFPFHQKLSGSNANTHFSFWIYSVLTNYEFGDTCLKGVNSDCVNLQG